MNSRRLRGLAATILATMILASRGDAQGGVFQRFNLDRLQLVSLGGGVGRIHPSQVEPVPIYLLQTDYGEIAPAWRVAFTISFWDSEYRGNVVQAFVDSLNSNLVDPTGTARVAPSPVSVYDATFGMGFRRYLSPRSAVTPTLTLGVAAHFINAEGRLIRGTFVERALDDIAAGLFAGTGVQARFFGRIQIEANVRGDLLSGYRSTQINGGASYYFGEPRRTRPAVRLRR